MFRCKIWWLQCSSGLFVWPNTYLMWTSALRDATAVSVKFPRAYLQVNAWSAADRGQITISQSQMAFILGCRAGVSREHVFMGCLAVRASVPQMSGTKVATVCRAQARARSCDASWRGRRRNNRFMALVLAPNSTAPSVEGTGQQRPQPRAIGECQQLVNRSPGRACC